MERIRILVVDDHPIVRQGIRSLLSNHAEFEIVGEAENGEMALVLLTEQRPDVTLLDIRMPDQTGIEVLRQIRQKQAKTKVLMLTSFEDDEYVMSALREGAQGYILKNISDEMLVSAIQATYRGERVLSPTVTERVVQNALSPTGSITRDLDLSEEEVDMLRLLVKGASNGEIAAELFMSQTSVKRKLNGIFSKMSVKSRAQAAAEAVRQGIV